jgi:hypothetical protein
MAKYYKSKADRAMTQLSEAYGQIVDDQELLNERTIATYEGGTEREVIEEILPALAVGAARVAPIIARGAAKLAPKIVKGAKALMPGAKAAAKQVGKAAVAGAAQGVQQRVQGAVAGQPQPQQEQEEEFSVGTLVDLNRLPGGGATGEIIDISTVKPGHYWVETDSDSENILVHADDISVIDDQAVEVDFSRPEDEPGSHTAGRVGGV